MGQGLVADRLTGGDHGGLSGLADDDHSHYFLADGTRALTGPLRCTGIQSATLGSGNTNDFSLDATTTILRITQNAADSTLTGIANGTDGRILIVQEVGGSGGNLIMSNQNANSSAANRFFMPSNQTRTYAQAGGIIIWYDGTTSRWRVASGAQTGGV